MEDEVESLSRDVEFTYEWYRSFLDELGSRFDTVRRFSNVSTENEVILRHDVDLSTEAALKMATLEDEFDVTSTYCFLLSSPLYNAFDRAHRERIREIEAMGHEIALHFSTHAYWPVDDLPDMETISERVTDELTVLDTITMEPPTTVSFHIPPSEVLNYAFDGFQSTYAPAVFGDIEYVADSGQRWRDEPPVLEDVSSVQVLTHPGLWGETEASFEASIRGAIREACNHTRQESTREFIHDERSMIRDSAEETDV